MLPAIYVPDNVAILTEIAGDTFINKAPLVLKRRRANTVLWYVVFRLYFVAPMV
jgi:hypothetical protein